MTAESPIAPEEFTDVPLEPGVRAVRFLHKVYSYEYNDVVTFLPPEEAVAFSHDILSYWYGHRIYGAKQPRREALTRIKRQMDDYLDNLPCIDVPEHMDPTRINFHIESHLHEVARYLRTSVRFGSLRAELVDRLHARAAAVAEQQEGIAPRSWLEGRQAAFELLYGEDKGTFVKRSEEAADTTRVPLTHLALRFDARGRTPAGVQPYETLMERVGTILLHHEQMARHDVRVQAAYTFVNPERDLPRVAALTGHVIWLWERAWYRQNALNNIAADENPSPFVDLPAHMTTRDLLNPAAQLVIEAAAAVGGMIGRIKDRAGHPLGNLLSRHGPSDFARWLSGHIIREYCAEQQLDPALWLDYLRPNRLINIAVGYSMNPLARVQEMMDYFHNELSIDNISAHIGWTRDDVAAAFTHGNRMLLLDNYSDPLAFVSTIAHELETTLSTNELAQELGWPPQRVDKMFSMGYRAHAVIKNQDPLAYLRRRAEQVDDLPDVRTIAHLIGWSVWETKQLFTPGELRNVYLWWDNPYDRMKEAAHAYKVVLDHTNLMRELQLTENEVKVFFPNHVRRRLAFSQRDPLARTREIVTTSRNLRRLYPDFSDYVVKRLAAWGSPDTAFAWAKIVDREYRAPPKGVGARLWTACVAVLASASRVEWMRAYRRIIALRHTTVSFDDMLEGQRTLYERVADQSAIAADPADLIAGDDGPSEMLLLLAAKAGVAADELQALLTECEAGVPDTGSLGNLGVFLERLRDAADTALPEAS